VVGHGDLVGNFYSIIFSLDHIIFKENVCASCVVHI
jgi:hypothetical protein